MKKIISKYFVYVENFLNKGRFVFKKITPPEKVKTLIKSLRPYKTEHELIRFGGVTDGGYLIPNDIQGISACFSPGVHKVSEFELDCIKAGMKVYMADKSVEKPNLNIEESNYKFIKKFIGCLNDDDFITMDQWVSENDKIQDADLLLQMDIEGSEYVSIINTTDELMKRFRIIVIEFHSLQDLWQPRFFDFAAVTFRKILQTHTCVHIHPNNGDGLEKRLGVDIPKSAEFTFLRNDRIKSKQPASKFPHSLDYDNTKKTPLILPKIWYTND